MASPTPLDSPHKTDARSSAAQWLAQYTAVSQAEELIRGILPHIVGRRKGEDAARQALRALGLLAEELLREKALAESAEQEELGEGDVPWLLKVGDAAKLLSIHPDTLRDLLKGGALPHVLVGSEVRVSVRDIRLWIGRNTQSRLRATALRVQGKYKAA